MIDVKNLKKSFGDVHVLKGITTHVNKGECICIIGPSGSGKSTLLHLIGGLDRPDSGKVWIDGTDIYSRKDDKLAQFRRKKIGFIFQDFNLIPSLNVWENIVLPLGLDNRKVKPREVEDILKKIGL